MARTESEQLVFSVEARIAAMEKQMARAARTTDRTFTTMENRSKRAAVTMEKEMEKGAARVGGAMKKFGGGLLAGVAAGGIAGIIGQIGEIAGSIATIGDEAKRAGVSVKAFQELKFVAEQNRIGVDQLTDGLKELSLRADEFAVTGKGAAAEAFGRIGFGATDVAKKLKDPSELMLEIIGRLGKLDKAAQIRISDEIFGGSAGERFVELIDQGETGIRQTIARANELGAVLDEEMIKKAAEVDRRFKEISATVGNTLKSAIVSATDSLALFIDGFRAFENQRSSTLDEKIASIGRERLEVEQDIARIRNEQRSNQSVIAAAENRILDGKIVGKQKQLDELSRQELELKNILTQRTPPLMVTDRTWTPPPATAAPAANARSSSRGSSTSSIVKEREAVAELITELEEELRLVGATDLERETAIMLRQAGAAATADERAKVVALTAAIHAEREARDKATEAAAELRDIGRDVLGGMVSDLREGKKAADIFANALDRIADRVLNLALDSVFSSGTGGGNLLADLLKPKGFASGGYTGAGGKNMPAGIVHRGEYVFSKAAVNRLGAANLDRMHRSAKGYASGGYVGDGRAELCFGEVAA